MVLRDLQLPIPARLPLSDFEWDILVLPYPQAR